MASKKKAAATPKTMTVQGAWVYKGKGEASEGKKAEPNAAAPASISVKTISALPHSEWLPVTSLKSGYTVFVPLPIRLIHQIPDDKGGGCIVRGAHGDEATARESVLESSRDVEWLSSQGGEHLESSRVGAFTASPSLWREAPASAYARHGQSEGKKL